MLKKGFLTFTMLLLTVASGAAFAQTQTCPRPDCPNQGQNCPRQGQNCPNQGQCPRGTGSTAQKGPAATGAGMGRRAAMGNRCGRRMNPPSTQENKK